jgi:hypothetical protein
MTPPRAVERLGRYRAQAEAMVDVLAERARVHDEDEAGERLAHALRERGNAVLDSWEQVLASAVEGSGQRRYSPYDEAKEGKALLRTLEDAREGVTEHERKFIAPTSMRDVEGAVHVWVDRSMILGGR